MKHVSLFSGIGGLDLAAQWAGFQTVCFCEIDPFCQKVLTARFPGIPIHGDIKTFDPEPFRGTDLLTAGFPCQPVSNCGKMLAQGDERWLWPEVDRLVRVIRPRFILLENVTGLLNRGFGIVLGDLASAGFDAEWQVLPASAFGAFHDRERVFVLAYPTGKYGVTHDLLEASQEWTTQVQLGRLHRLEVATRGRAPQARLECEPDVARLVHRIPQPVDDLRTLGNSVVPAQAFPILQAIAQAITEERGSEAKPSEPNSPPETPIQPEEKASTQEVPG